MTWLLLYVLAGHLHAVPDLPSLEACVQAAEAVTAPGAHSFACVRSGEVSA